MYIQPEKQGGNRQQSMHGGYNSVAPQWCVFPLLPSPGAKWRRLRTPNYGASRCPAPRLAVRLPRFALFGALVLTLLHSHRACASPTPPPSCEHHAQTRLSPRRRDAMPQIPGLKLRLPLIIGAACLPNAPKTLRPEAKKPAACGAAPAAARLAAIAAPGYAITLGVHAVNASGISGKPTDAQIFAQNRGAMTARCAPLAPRSRPAALPPRSWRSDKGAAP